MPTSNLPKPLCQIANTNEKIDEWMHFPELELMRFKYLMSQMEQEITFDGNDLPEYLSRNLLVLYYIKITKSSVTL